MLGDDVSHSGLEAWPPGEEPEEEEEEEGKDDDG
jgi:hypothetical protein